MAVDRVRAYLAPFGMEGRIREFACSSATVALAAQALATDPARIAKTLAFASADGEGCLIVVAAGDARVDNAKFRARFAHKARMLAHERVTALTGYAVGGVCPFDLPESIPVYLDVSLQRFDRVYPAAGSDCSAVALSVDELFRLARAEAYVDVCK